MKILKDIYMRPEIKFRFAKTIAGQKEMKYIFILIFLSTIFVFWNIRMHKCFISGYCLDKIYHPKWNFIAVIITTV